MLQIASKLAWKEYYEHPEFKAANEAVRAETARIDAEIEKLQQEKEAARRAYGHRVNNNEVLAKIKAEQVDTAEDAERNERRYLDEKGWHMYRSKHNEDFEKWAITQGYLEWVDGAGLVLNVEKAKVALSEREVAQ